MSGICHILECFLIKPVKDRNNPVTGFQRFSRPGSNAVVTDTVPEVQNPDFIRLVIPGETEICVLSVYSDRAGKEIIAVTFIHQIDADILSVRQGEPEAVEMIFHPAGIPVCQHITGKTKGDAVLLIIREHIDLCFHRRGIIQALL